MPGDDSPYACLRDEAAALRRDVVEALFACGGGHYGGSLSVVDILLILYRCEPALQAEAPGRDRLILSKGHAAVALYAVLRRLGLADEPLGEYGTLGSAYQGHPDMTFLPAVDFSSGSLGQGLAVGLGMAMALKPGGAHVWVVLGDGECQEGQIWEAAQLAERYRADNLTAVIDGNGHQEFGWPGATGEDAQPVKRLAEKWRAFGWEMDEVDGHDHRALAAAFARARATEGRPCAVLARTTKGKGVRLIESDPVRFHCTSVTEEEHQQIVGSLA